MELKNIEAFIKVVETGSFSAAAKELFITQPTISVRIQHLEEELNTALFKRENGKNIMLTEEGEKVFPYFKEAMNLIKLASYLMHDDSKKGKKIVIGFPNYMGVEIVPELLKILYDRFPRIEFDVSISLNDEIIKDIQTEGIDFGFAYTDPREPIQGLEKIRVAQDQSILVSTPNHPLTKKGRLSAADLKEERIVVYNRNFSTTKLIENFINKQELKDYKMVEISNLGWLKMMVRKGLGVAFLQKMIVNDELKNGSLVELPLADPLAPIEVCVLFKPSVPEEVKEIVIQTSRDLFHS